MRLWKDVESYPHLKWRKTAKNKVMHEVVHVIHQKRGKTSVNDVKNLERAFCDFAIKMQIFKEICEKILTF